MGLMDRGCVVGFGLGAAAALIITILLLQLSRPDGMGAVAVPHRLLAPQINGLSENVVGPSSCPKVASSDRSSHKKSETRGKYVPFRSEEPPKRKRADGKLYSSQRCIGPQNNRQARGYMHRICRFENICFKPSTREFLYYEKIRSPKVFDMKDGELMDFSRDGIPFMTLFAYSPLNAQWSPSTVVEAIPESADIRTGKHFLFRHWDTEGNLLHTVFEGLGLIYYTMARFLDVDHEVQILHGHELPDMNQPNMRKNFEAVLPALSSKPLLSLADYGKGSELVCLETMYIGGVTSFFLMTEEPFIEGWEPYITSYIELLQDYYDIHPQLPEKPLIYVTKKSHSRWTAPGFKLHRAIANVDEVFSYLVETYPFAEVVMMEWHTMESLEQEMEIMSRASLLITPCGGVSGNAAFLPTDAHAIIMDYYSDGNRPETFGFAPGMSGSMEISFWNRLPRLQKMYYQVFSTDDFVWDNNDRSNPREQSSILVKMDRLKRLVDVALSKMGYM